MQTTTTFQNPPRILRNLAIIAGIVIAVGLFALTISRLGIFQFGARPDLSTTTGSALLHTENFAFGAGEVRLPAGDLHLLLRRPRPSRSRHGRHHDYRTIWKR